MRSPAIRSLIWMRSDGVAGLLGGMIAETAIFVVVVLGIELIVWATRRLVARVCPRCVWQDPLASMNEEDRLKVGEAPMDRSRWIGRLDLAIVLQGFRSLLSYFGKKGSRDAGRSELNRWAMLRSLLCLVAGTAIAGAVTLLLLQSPARGQMLFAVFAGSTLGFLAAHQIAPTPIAAAAWLGPIILAIGLYALAAASGDGSGPKAWLSMPLYARVLPVDWLTMGCGGSLLGYWISGRVHELRHTEKKAKRD
jgi:hypothetical protein